MRKSLSKKSLDQLTKPHRALFDKVEETMERLLDRPTLKTMDKPARLAKFAGIKARVYEVLNKHRADIDAGITGQAITELSNLKCLQKP